MSLVLSIDTSRHENNDDMPADLTEPYRYAFPYFHKSSEVPDLFKSINSFTFIHAKTNVSIETQSRLLEKLGTKIISRCQTNPHESWWVDSCGENACHRFCQALRFQKGIDDDLSIGVLENLINAEPRTAFTLNNWTDTPLHQFVAHCGLTKDRTDRAPPMSDLCASGSGMTVKETPSSVKVMEILLRAAPKSVFTVNYERALPLHELCGLNRLGSQACDNFPYASFPIRSFFSDPSQMETGDHHAHTRTSMDIFHQDKNVQDTHLLAVQHLVTEYRKGLLFLDTKKKSPLYRAVESRHCSAEVVTYILGEMESLFSSRDHPVPVKATEDAKPHLMRRAILGLKSEDSSSADSVRIANPLGDLWNVFLSPRNVTAEDVDLFQNHFGRHISDNGTRKLTLSQLLISLSVATTEQNEHERDNCTLKMALNRLGSTWTKSLILMSAAYHGSVEAIISKDWKPLHSAIYLSAPRCALYTLATLYPEELTKYDEFMDCETPLSLSLSKWDDLNRAWDDYDSYEGIDPISVNTQQHSIFDMNAVQLLLSLDASASSIRNGQGRYPLHLALANDLDWNCGTADIFSVYPLAASVQDPVTILYPFMTAASKNGKKSMGRNDQNQLCSVYTLLRADPSVIT